MRAEEPDISVYLWLSVSTFTERVENIGSFGLMVRTAVKRVFKV